MDKDTWKELKNIMTDENMSEWQKTEEMYKLGYYKGLDQSLLEERFYLV